MDDPSNKRRSPSALGPGSQATLLSGSVGLPCRSMVGAALPETPYRDWKRGVDLSRSPTRRRMTAVALANKVARIVFVLMTRGGQYDDRPVAA